MKKAFFRFIKLVGSILLMVLALVLFILLSIVGFGWSFYALIYKRTIGQTFDGLTHYFTRIALSIDQLGNVAFAGMLNDVLIDKDLNKLAHLHGDPDETISEVLGWNKLTGALSSRGVWLATILDKLDENHCIDSAESAYEKAIEKLNRYSSIIEN